jgi:hypothetical protein
MPVQIDPPITAVGEVEIDEILASSTVSSATLVVSPRVPEMVTGEAVETTVVEMLKVAEVALSATVTEAGTAAAELLDVSETVNPPDGAGPVSLTVPVAGPPPTTEIGSTVTLLRPDP